jgi:hypothetical protein
VELLATCAALAFVGMVAFPLCASTRAHSDRVGCFNNLRQLGLAALKYADENDSTFPPRRSPAWPTRLLHYYGTTNILLCPADGPNPLTYGPTNADAAPRSYIMNGWADYFASQPGSPLTNVMPISALGEPAQTIVFGEKQTESGHFWMDYWAGDDYLEVDQGRHYASRQNHTDGVSNHAFVDGSVRLLKFGEAFDPVILWFVDPRWRNMSAGQ